MWDLDVFATSSCVLCIFFVFVFFVFLVFGWFKSCVEFTILCIHCLSLMLHLIEQKYIN